MVRVRQLITYYGTHGVERGAQRDGQEFMNVLLQCVVTEH